MKIVLEFGFLSLPINLDIKTTLKFVISACLFSLLGIYFLQHQLWQQTSSDSGKRTFEIWRCLQLPLNLANKHAD